MLLADVLPSIAVPLFFLIIGYLFFQGLEKWHWNKWKRKKTSYKDAIDSLLNLGNLYIACVYSHQCRLSLADGRGRTPLSQWFTEKGASECGGTQS